MLTGVALKNSQSFTMATKQYCFKRDCLSVETRPTAKEMYRHAFCFCDFDLDPMTLIYESDRDVLKMYLRTKTQLSTSRHSRVRAQQTDRQTDRQRDRQTERCD